jgi:hypothetical protein
MILIIAIDGFNKIYSSTTRPIEASVSFFIIMLGPILIGNWALKPFQYTRLSISPLLFVGCGKVNWAVA